MLSLNHTELLLYVYIIFSLGSIAFAHAFTTMKEDFFLL